MSIALVEYDALFGGYKYLEYDETLFHINV